MKTCPKCHRDFSESFDTCPHDDTPLQVKQVPIVAKVDPEPEEPAPYFTSKMPARTPVADRKPATDGPLGAEPEPTRRLRPAPPKATPPVEETRTLKAYSPEPSPAHHRTPASPPEKPWTQFLPWVITCICLCVTVYALVYASKSR